MPDDIYIFLFILDILSILAILLRFRAVFEAGGGCTGYTGDTAVYQFDSQPEPPEASDYPARGAHASARGLTFVQSCGKLLDERGMARDKPPQCHSL